MRAGEVLTRARRIPAKAKSLADLGQKFGPTLYEAEAYYLIAEESAAADGVLRRRTKHALTMTSDELANFTRWLDRAA